MNHVLVRKITILVTLAALAACFLFAWATYAHAVGKGRNMEYKENDVGPVIFSGTAHAAFKCSDCHPAFFPMKKKTVLKHIHMDAGQHCGACHNDNEKTKPAFKAFPTTGDCRMCHRESEK